MACCYLSWLFGLILIGGDAQLEVEFLFSLLERIINSETEAIMRYETLTATLFIAVTLVDKKKKKHLYSLHKDHLVGIFNHVTWFETCKVYRS